MHVDAIVGDIHGEILGRLPRGGNGMFVLVLKASKIDAKMSAN